MSGTGPTGNEVAGKRESKDTFGPGGGNAHQFGVAMGKEGRGVKPEHYQHAVADKARGDLVAAALRGDPLVPPRANTFPLVVLERKGFSSDKSLPVLAELTLEEFARIRGFTRNVGLLLFSISPDERRVPRLGKDWQPHVKGMVIRRDQQYLLNGRQLLFEGWHDEWTSHPDGLVVRCGHQFALYPIGGKRRVLFDGDYDEWWVHPKGIVTRKGDVFYLNGIHPVFQGQWKTVQSCLTGVALQSDYVTRDPREEKVMVFLLSPYECPDGEDRGYVHLYTGSRRALDWKIQSVPAEFTPAKVILRACVRESPEREEQSDENGLKVVYCHHNFRNPFFTSSDPAVAARNDWLPHPDGVVLQYKSGEFLSVDLHRGLEKYPREQENRCLYFGHTTQTAAHPYGVIIHFGVASAGDEQSFVLA